MGKLLHPGFRQSCCDSTHIERRRSNSDEYLGYDPSETEQNPIKITLLVDCHPAPSEFLSNNVVPGKRVTCIDSLTFFLKGRISDPKLDCIIIFADFKDENFRFEINDDFSQCMIFRIRVIPPTLSNTFDRETIHLMK